MPEKRSAAFSPKNAMTVRGALYMERFRAVFLLLMPVCKKDDPVSFGQDRPFFVFAARCFRRLLLQILFELLSFLFRILSKVTLAETLQTF